MIQQIILGDCREELKKIENNFVDLIIIDPPYLTTSEKWDKVEVVNQELSVQLFRVAKDSCSLYVWCGIGEKSQSLIRWFPVFSKDWYFKDLITWKKQRGIGMRKGWLYTREEIMWFVKDNKRFIWNKENQYLTEKTNRKDLGYNNKPRKSEYKRITNVWVDLTETCQLRKEVVNHSSQKPLSCLNRIIRLHTQKNDLILDCFAGSGSAGLASKNLNRQFILIEKEEKYYNICKNRIEGTIIENSTPL